MSEEQKIKKKREKRAERTKNRCGKEDSEHPRVCSRVGGAVASAVRGVVRNP